MTHLNERDSRDLVLQTEGDKGELDERRREAVVERTTAKERAARAHAEMTTLRAEKQALERSHTHLQDLCQKLEAELHLLLEERAKALETHSQVVPPHSFQTGKPLLYILILFLFLII